jgi:RNA-binding protein 39
VQVTMTTVMKTENDSQDKVQQEPSMVTGTKDVEMGSEEDMEAKLRERLKAKTKSAKEETEAKLRERLKAKTKGRKERMEQDSASSSVNSKDPGSRPHDRRSSRDRGGPYPPRRGSGGSGDYRDDYRAGSGPPPPGGPAYGNGHPNRYGGNYPPGPGGPPPPHWRGPPSSSRGGPPGPPRYHSPRDEDDFGRRRPPGAPGTGADRAPRSRSRSRSRSHSDASGSSASSSSSIDSRRRDRSRSRSRSRDRDRTHSSRRRSRSSSRSASSRSSYSDSDDSRSSSSDGSRSVAAKGTSGAGTKSKATTKEDVYTKDQRTVFVNQLVMRATERDLRKYFRKMDCKVNDVIFLHDKRSGRHKGCAYVELGKMEDVIKAVALSGEAPDFQRFPILVKASEAEKNYVAKEAASGVTTASQAALAAMQTGVPVKAAPMVGPDGKLIESQKVYVGSLSPSVSQEHLFALFSPFGQLERVVVQMDPSTGVSKGFAFLSFRDPKEANLAIQTMAGQILAGRPMKTGWANQVSSIPGVETVTSGEFPADASERTTRAYQVLAQLTNGAPVPAAATTATQAAVQQLVMGQSQSAAPAMPAAAGIPRVGTVAEARASLAAGNATATQGPPTMLAQPQVWAATTAAAAAAMPTAAAMVDATKVGNAESPTKNVLVHNMYNKDEETDPGWEEEIRLEFQEESAKFGKIVKVTVMFKEPGGKIYASFDSIQGAQSCTSSLAGRWFDKRQLRVEFVKDEELPSE